MKTATLDAPKIEIGKLGNQFWGMAGLHNHPNSYSQNSEKPTLLKI